MVKVRPGLAEDHRDPALFKMAINKKLRGCDLVTMNAQDTGLCEKVPKFQNRLMAVFQTQFGKDVRCMVAHRLF